MFHNNHLSRIKYGLSSQTMFLFSMVAVIHYVYSAGMPVSSGWSHTKLVNTDLQLE